MRILIADDDSLTRISLVSMIQEMTHPFEICGEAENDEELVHLLQEQLPDIVLLDFLMPTNNGLEMMKRGMELSPSTKWIILSRFSDFDNAHESVKLGASEYLLKPPSAQELEKAMLCAGNIVTERNVHLHKQVEYSLESIFSGFADLSLEDAEAFVHQAEFRGTQLFMDSYLEEPLRTEVEQSWMDKLRSQLKLVKSDMFYTKLLQLPCGAKTFVCAWHPDKQKNGQRLMKELFLKLEAQLVELKSEQAALTFISTNVCSSLSRLKDELAVVSHFGDLRVTRGVNRHWTLSQLDPHDLEWLLSIGQLLAELSSAYLDKNYMAYMNRVDRLQSYITRQGLQTIPSKNKLAIAQFIQRSIRCHMKPKSEQWIDQLYQHGETLLPHFGLRDSGDRMIERVILQLEQNYWRSITLSEVAKQSQTTTHYLNTQFQQTTGVTFAKYLTRLRITKAKELFVDPSLLVKQAAAKVGFISASHFSKCFSEFEGCTPSAYKQMLKNLEGES